MLNVLGVLYFIYIKSCYKITLIICYLCATEGIPNSYRRIADLIGKSFSFFTDSCSNLFCHLSCWYVYIRLISNSRLHVNYRLNSMRFVSIIFKLLILIDKGTAFLAKLQIWAIICCLFCNYNPKCLKYEFNIIKETLIFYVVKIEF